MPVESSDTDKFVRDLMALNAVANQQATQVLQLAALAMQLKGMNDLDPTQAVLESKLAGMMGGGARGLRLPENPLIKEQK
jgi:hypothetical protein